MRNSITIAILALDALIYSVIGLALVFVPIQVSTLFVSTSVDVSVLPLALRLIGAFMALVAFTAAASLLPILEKTRVYVLTALSIVPTAFTLLAAFNHSEITSQTSLVLLLTFSSVSALLHLMVSLLLVLPLEIPENAYIRIQNHDKSPSRLLSLAKSQQKLIASACLVLLVRLPFSLSIPHFVSAVIGALIEHDSSKAYWNVLFLFIAGTIDSVLDFWCIFLFGLAQQRIVRDLRKSLLSVILRQEIGFFDETSSGELSSRLSADCAQMASNLTFVFRFAIESVVRVVGIAAYMFVFSPKLAAVACGIIPFIAVVNKVYGTLLQSNAEKVQDALAKANDIAQEAIGCIRTVVSFANESFIEQRYSDGIDRHYQLNVFQVCISGIYYMVVSTFLVNTVVQAALLLYGITLVGQGMKVRILIAFMLYQSQLQEYCMNLFNAFTDWVTSMGAGAQVFALLDRKPKQMQTVPNAERQMQTVPNAIEGIVEFENVSFQYPTRDGSVLCNLNLKVGEPGTITAIVGPSGSGKSTLFHLLEHFYEPQRGQVLLDGIPVHEYDREFLHSQIALVSQEPVLFSGSIRDNILFGLKDRLNVKAESMMRKAASIANADGFINALEHQYDTQVGERGVKLSGGQKQRIAIARAIVGDPQILLLDEATSALDSESESTVQKALEQAMKGRTVFVIAHRLSTISSSDLIIVMDNGTIVESGTHRELSIKPLDPSNVSYRSLLERQNLFSPNQRTG